MLANISKRIVKKIYKNVIVLYTKQSPQVEENTIKWQFFL